MNAIEILRQREETAHRAAAAAYLAALRSPTIDADTLADVAGGMGKTSKDVERDLAILKEHSALVRAVERFGPLGELIERRRVNRKELADAREQLERATNELQRLELESSGISTSRIILDNAERRLAAFEQAHRDLFPLDNPAGDGEHGDD